MLGGTGGTEGEKGQASLPVHGRVRVLAWLRDVLQETVLFSVKAHIPSASLLSFFLLRSPATAPEQRRATEAYNQLGTAYSRGVC